MNRGIYKITNLITKKFYIGSAKNIDKRWKRHIYELINNKHNNIYLQNAWNKYGEEAFKFEILELVKDAKMLYEREQWWLNCYTPFNSKRGYNLSKLAQGGGFKLSQVSIDKIKKSAIGNKNRRNKERWPCEDGIYCKCCDCLTVIKFEQFFRNSKRHRVVSNA